MYECFCIVLCSEDAPEIDPGLFQPAVKVQSKPKVEVATSDESNDKRLKQLRKKLDQITKLKERQEKGEVLEQNQVYTLHDVYIYLSVPVILC